MRFVGLSGAAKSSRKAAKKNFRFFRFFRFFFRFGTPTRFYKYSEFTLKVYHDNIPLGMFLSVEENAKKIMASHRDASFIDNSVVS